MKRKSIDAAKTALTPREMLKAAYFHEIRGVPQHVLADIFEVNIGRVNEAVQAIRAVCYPEEEDHNDLKELGLLD
jgi:hypothetical protein